MSSERTSLQADSRGESQYSDNTPQDTPFIPPQTTFLPGHSLASTPRASTYGTPDAADNSVPLLASDDALNAPHATDTYDPYASKELATPPFEGTDGARPYPTSRASRPPWYKRPIFWLAGVAAIIIIVLAVILPVYFTIIKPNKHNSTLTSGASDNGGSSSGSNSTTTSSPNPESPVAAITGGNGSIIVLSDGTNFTYLNEFGGYWVFDEKDPYNNGARPNSWTPALNETWTWGEDHVYGVNLGGFVVIEPFIVPSLFQANPSAVDEWTLSESLTASGTLQQTLEQHYASFITEQDIAQIAGAGLNWVRLPIPLWAIEAWDNVGLDANGNTIAEPFLAKVCWNYILQVIEWARKYGIRVNLDLHTAPGSQNGYNHSGKEGSINWLNGPMGVANAERHLDYIRIITEFISQDQYKDVIPMFGIVNEALLTTIGIDQLTTFYLLAHDTIRSITGLGEGNGPYISIHDGFTGLSQWSGFLTGSDRFVLDTHPYFAFDGQTNTQPINVPATGNPSIMGGQWPQQACNSWGPMMNSSRRNFGVTIAGEFSAGFTDCGLWVRGVNITPTGQDCAQWFNATAFDDDTKEGLMNFVLASMDALGDWFFWTWKIGNSSDTDTVQAPLWSYQLGLENGWIPKDPRQALGMCESLGVQPQAPFNGSYQSWQTGGAGAGTIVASSVATYGVWPPATLANVASPSLTLLPQYTSTATMVTLPPPTFSAATVSSEDGWKDASDTASKVTAVSGCPYPFAWDALNSVIPTGGCAAVGTFAGAATPTPTAASTPAITPAPTAPATTA